MSEEGYFFWQRGGLWFSLCQFRNNILFASNQSPGAVTGIVQMVADTLSEIWNWRSCVLVWTPVRHGVTAPTWRILPERWESV